MEIDEWHNNMKDFIDKSHKEMYIAGRVDYKGSKELSKRNQKWLEKEIKQEYRFLDSFKDDIVKGNLIEVSPSAVETRAGLYAEKTGGLYNAGQVSAYEEYPGVNIYWRLGLPMTQHCDDCPSLAAGSPYNVDNPLPTYPLAGDTQCLMNCYCSLWFEKDGNWEGEIV